MVTTTQVVTPIVITIIHIFGYILLFLNAWYLHCTSGYDGEFFMDGPNATEDLENLKSRRCCKFRTRNAVNLLVVYKCILVIADFVFVFVYLNNVPEDPEKAILDSTPTILWLIPGMTYMILFLFMPIGIACGMDTIAHIGPIHAFNAYDFLHFVLFWGLFLFMLTCAGGVCSDMHEDIRGLASGYAVIPMAWCYFMMLAGACFNKGFFKLGKKIKTPSEALQLINDEMQRTPSITWTVTCGHTRETRRSSRFYELHSESKCYEFGSDDVRRTVKPENLSVDMFKSAFTKLLIMADIKPGDVQQMKQMKIAQKQFKLTHKGHDEELRLAIEDNTAEKYLVQKDPNDTPPDKFYSKTTYWVCTALALSIPYRIYLYCTMGHIKVKIRRRVFGVGQGQVHGRGRSLMYSAHSAYPEPEIAEQIELSQLELEEQPEPGYRHNPSAPQTQPGVPPNSYDEQRYGSEPVHHGPGRGSRYPPVHQSGPNQYGQSEYGQAQSYDRGQPHRYSPTQPYNNRYGQSQHHPQGYEQRNQRPPYHHSYNPQPQNPRGGGEYSPDSGDTKSPPPADELPSYHEALYTITEPDQGYVPWQFQYQNRESGV